MTQVALLLALSAPAHAGECTVAGQSLGDWVESLWVGLSNVKPTRAQVAAAKANGASAVHNYPAGWGWNRTDFFGIEVTLPKGKDGKEKVTPQEVLDLVRDDPTSLGSRFKGWVSWKRAGKGGRKRGEIVDLNIWGPDNGAITYLDTDTSDGDFTVMTVENATSGTHPVSGARRWGYERLANGRVLFYTVGIESANVWGSGDVGNHLQYKTWRDLMRDIGRFVGHRGGTQHRIYIDDEWQPNGLTPGKNTKADIDHPGGIDVDVGAGFYDALEKAERDALRHMPLF